MKAQPKYLILNPLLLIIIWLIVMPVRSGSSSPNANSTIPCDLNHSTLRSAVQRIFSRKKRFLLLPPGGSLKLTANVGKRILAKYPRGFTFAFEAATYYEAFSKRIDLIPKFLRKPTKATTKPSGPTKPILVYIPGTEIRYKAKPAKKPTKVQRIDADDGVDLEWSDMQATTNKYAEKYADPYYWLKYSKFGEADYKQKYAWTPAEPEQEYQYHPMPNAKWTRWTTARRPDGNWWQRSSLNKTRHHYKATVDDYGEDAIYKKQSLHHYHGHRDRRELFHSIGALSGVLGFDMKACVLRAICESENLLLPTGYSMLQDMIRAILTMPLPLGSDGDEYNEAMAASADTCDRQYRQKCPISLVNWLINPEKTFSS